MKRRDFLKLALIPLALPALGSCSANLRREYEELDKNTRKKIEYGDIVAWNYNGKIEFGRSNSRYMGINFMSVSEINDMSRQKSIPFYENAVAITIDGRVLVGKNMRNRKDLEEIIKNLRNKQEWNRM